MGFKPILIFTDLKGPSIVASTQQQTIALSTAWQGNLLALGCVSAYNNHVINSYEEAEIYESIWV
ncbi:hypothetical protein HMPREF0496_0042 [Lentilactobacillus hilgardii ATCC 27305]|nr:hypothetical protein HMPREF0496_0042 [Lentilactobacillus hilgardii ATCC 27305]